MLQPDGVRLQVKTRWLPLEGGLSQLSAIRKLESRGFDYVMAVLLDKNFDVAEAYQIPYAAVGRLASFAAHTNSHRLVLTPNVCRDPDCLDITEKLRAADQRRRPRSPSGTHRSRYSKASAVRSASNGLQG